MKKGDLEVGVEYAVVDMTTPIPEGGITAMHDREYRAGGFPMKAHRARVVEIGAEYVTPGRFSFDPKVTAKGIKVEWIETAKFGGRMRMTAHSDESIITSARYFFVPWAEYEPEHKRRAEAAARQTVEDEANEKIQERVLGRLEALGVEATGHGFSKVTLDAVVVERLLNGVGRTDA